MWHTSDADTGMQYTALFCFQRAWVSLPIFIFFCTMSTPWFGAIVFALGALVCTVWWSVSLHFYTFVTMASICTFCAKNIWCTGVNLHIWSSTNLHPSPMHGPSVADFLFVSGSKFLQHARNVCEACKKHFQCWHRNWHCFHNLHIAMYWYTVRHKM